MSSSFPNGAIFALGTTLDAAKTVTAITNANPGVASSTAHGYADGDILLLSMPSVLDQRMVLRREQQARGAGNDGIDARGSTDFDPEQRQASVWVLRRK